MDRRTWLKTSIAGGAGLAATGLVPGGLGARGLELAGLGPGRIPRARNVIFFAYDGLTWEDLATARYYRMRHGARMLELERLLRGGASGSMLTHSLTSVVTDSAAASTAWATGRKCVNREVSQFPDGTPLTTILELARDRGLATGLVTSTRITHATPACWAAHLDRRDLEDEIALQYLDAGVDVLLGGGSAHFDPSDRSDGRDLWDAFQARGYEVLRNPSDLERATGTRLLGAFTRGHLAYEIDRVHQAAPSPSLEQITRKGLDVLEGADRGFVLQIEAGRIDHASHNNDPGAALHDILAADDALRVALDFTERVPGTLLIMASDHGTGPGAVHGSGPWYLDSSAAFDRIRLPRASFEHFLSRIGGDATAPEVRDATSDLLGVELDSKRSELLARVISRDTVVGNQRAYRTQPYNGIHQVLTDSDPATEEGLNVNFVSGQHVAGPVPVALHGAGVEGRGLGIVDNTELFTLMTHALGIQFENPLLNEEEALRMGYTPGLEGGDGSGARVRGRDTAGPEPEANPHWV